MLRNNINMVVRETKREIGEKLASELGIPLLTARLLAARGFTDAAEAKHFLFADEDQVYDPFLLDGMGKAVQRIRRAMESREKVWVYGDYDADGVSSTALMIRLFERLAANFDYYIPNRNKEGYGLNMQALETAQKAGVTLIVTVDTGISAVAEIDYAARLGIEVIVTDHHEPPDVLPDAYALINPKKPGDRYPFKQLAGVGVALKLAQALLETVPDTYYELAAIGTVADLMPLLNENRLIVKKGIKAMRTDCSPGIRALLAIAGIHPANITSLQIAYALSPRINAGGRMDSAIPAVKLLTADNEQTAEQFARELDRLNRYRQETVEAITEEALAQLKETEISTQHVLIVASDGWNVGVVGIVAAKIAEKYHKPAIVLVMDAAAGLAKGSARSVAGFDIVHALARCGELLDHYGGHQAAAGLTIRLENLGLFKAEINHI
ncbi:MAG TPA: single-stranded-DNA-specific exonuclease RecJ, partial [Bacilli bacterium]